MMDNGVATGCVCRRRAARRTTTRWICTSRVWASCCWRWRVKLLTHETAERPDVAMGLCQVSVCGTISLPSGSRQDQLSVLLNTETNENCYLLNYSRLEDEVSSESETLLDSRFTAGLLAVTLPLWICHAANASAGLIKTQPL